MFNRMKASEHSNSAPRITHIVTFGRYPVETRFRDPPLKKNIPPYESYTRAIGINVIASSAQYTVIPTA